MLCSVIPAEVVLVVEVLPRRGSRGDQSRSREKREWREDTEELGERR